MKKRCLIILVILFVVYACKKEERPYVPVKRCSDLTRNMDTINKYIHGAWEWLEEKTYSRYNGLEYLTPNVPGYYQITLKLSGDTARFYKNNTIDSVYQFRIQREYEISNYSPDSLPVIVYYSFFSGQRRTYVPIMICRDQLLMQHQFVSSLVGESIWGRK